MDAEVSALSVLYAQYSCLPMSSDGPFAVSREATCHSAQDDNAIG